MGRNLAWPVSENPELLARAYEAHCSISARIIVSHGGCKRVLRNGLDTEQADVVEFLFWGPDHFSLVL